ncbi:MAG TPA: hypothetical protein PLN18_00900 [Candidatus Colwellbacteria bacterium]|nr:hypothetical protein [Candidatus Colwellbacteria bacterium]HQA95914.1 hypothetical protein [Candidatus Colwellbacteria bacterium]
MRSDRVQAALRELDRIGGEEMLRGSNDNERLGILEKLLPETCSWPIMPARELIFRIQKEWGIDMDVCPFYFLEDDESETQYCLYGGEKAECLCGQPCEKCVIRDQEEVVLF